jgi:hypothetical protein
MRDYRLYQHDGIFSGFRASNAIGRRSDGSWMSATVLANSDIPVEFVRLVRRMIEIGDESVIPKRPARRTDTGFPK